ncbi:MAG: MFS transporter [Solirubrobacterales bacterium]
MKRWLVLIIMCAAQFIMVLDTTVMNVSVSNVVADLDTSITMVQLAITLYTLVMGSFMLLGGRLGDIFGRKKIFGIGLIVYGVGSLTTALSPNVGWLLFGWSFVEGAGAVLVMPAIISLTASNYSGKDRATAYAALGGVAAAGAAAGPLIGGWVTEALTWRVVFASETLVCIVIVMFMRRIADAASEERGRIDWAGVALSSLGLGLIVLAMLQAGTWGLIHPTGALTIAGHEITPFGFSIVPFMVVAGFAVLYAFFAWERRVIARGGSPLMHPELLHKLQLRNGLVMLMAQQTVIGGMFFVIPIYLQYVLLKNAFDTGVKLAPMSIAMLIAAFSGPKLAEKRSPRQIVSCGLVLVIAGALLLITTITPELDDTLFAIGMAVFGAGFGLIASQLGNVIMSSVGDRDRGEAGGLQGTAQNIGTSLGVAMIGALLISSLSGGLTDTVQADPALSPQTKQAVAQHAQTGVDVMTEAQVRNVLSDSGLDESETEALVADYESAQLAAIKDAIMLAALLALIGLALAQRLPRIPGVELGAEDPVDADSPAPA